MKNRILTTIGILAFTTIINAKTIFIPADSSAPSILNYNLIGGSFQSYGCTGLDPTYWISGQGKEVNINFVNPQTNPSIRVWGMNTDDSAGSVN